MCTTWEVSTKFKGRRPVGVALGVVGGGVMDWEGGGAPWRGVGHVGPGGAVIGGAVCWGGQDDRLSS